MPSDNNTTAPIVPAGTGKNLFGSTMAFPNPAANTGEQTTTPEANKEGETTQPVQSNAPQGITFAELAAKKGFKDPDALASAYANLETSHTKKSMELSDLVAVRSSAGKDGTATPAAAAQAQQHLEREGYSPEEAVAIVRRMIQEEVAPVKETLAIRETFKNQDDMQYAPAVAELVRKNPTIPWDVALKAVKHDDLVAKVTTEAAQKTSRTETLRVQANAGSPDNRMSREINLDSIVKDKNVPFKEVQKMMKEHFSQ